MMETAALRPIPQDARAYKPLRQAQSPGTRTHTNRCAKPNPPRRARVQTTALSPIPQDTHAYKPLRQVQSPKTRALTNRYAKPNSPRHARTCVLPLGIAMSHCQVDWNPVTNLIVSGGEDGRYKVLLKLVVSGGETGCCTGAWVSSEHCGMQLHG